MNRAERRAEMKGSKSNQKRDGEKIMKSANVLEVKGNEKEVAMLPTPVEVKYNGVSYILDGIESVKKAIQASSSEFYDDSVLYSTYLAYYFRSIWSRKKIEDLEVVIFKNLYKKELVRGYIADDRQGYVDEVGYALNDLDFASFDEVLADNEDLKELDSVRVNILRKSFEEMKKALEEVGITNYEGNLNSKKKSEKDEMRLLINHFLGTLFTVPGSDSIFSPEIFTNMRERTLVDAFVELSKSGLTIWQATPTAKDKKGKYSYFTAACNPKLLDAGEDVTVKEVM
ncbi:hypothetical protein SAMN02745136_00423 [Anaerocolumna jejuensis DSM 15929]|uniref:Uncharacterized protein n=1 Tax=Anaerocolumna jejuensis DSM 15929 TaxID=1121322 RepID=A0A1M6KEH6_9FIRM|nr:hypothetical protein [Anaerocolumna jejuensis]SHJ57318.1 hypothetical protein SAMN02745136_00423 [Anaerocolumna jejuensis DSM 15929]